MANLDSFKNDGKCYSKINTLSDNSFNSYFDKYEYVSTYNNIINDCKNKANEQQKEFFLISDVKKLGNDIKYTCYIPTVKSNCENNTLESLFKPFSEMIDTIFGNKDIIGNRGGTIINKNNIIYDTSFINFNPENEVEDCFKLTKKNGESYSFAKSNKYTLYESNILNSPDVLSSLANMKDVSYYNNKLNTVFDYTNVSTNLYNKIYEYILSENSINFLNENLDSAIHNTVNKYYEMQNSLSEIQKDISLVNIVTKEYTNYFKTVQQTINEKKRKIHELIGLDGGNNARFQDTRKMKKMILSEIIILLLIIIFSIYFNSKKK